MVKVSFIVDGETEMKMFQHETVKQHFQDYYGLQLKQVYKFKSKKVKQYAQILKAKGAFKVILLKDLEQLSYKDARNLLYKQEEIIEDVVVLFAKRMIEAWLLADTSTLRKVLKDPDVQQISNPENIANPYRTLKHKLQQVNKSYAKLGKPEIASLFLEHGFSIQQAAQHQQCKSAQKFHKKMRELGQQG